MTNLSDSEAEMLARVLADLSATIEQRAAEADASASYTAKLLSKGPNKTAKKLGEEAVELVIALTSENEQNVASETADLLYHLLVALKSRDVSLARVAGILAERQGMSGLTEKASRPAD